ncbi:MAG: protein kinase [Planctomycetes bacterium]|nr:protein kinase [Planctomycetota bacterium]
MTFGSIMPEHDIACPKCKGPLPRPREAKTTTVKCPGCGSSVTIQFAAPAPAPRRPSEAEGVALPVGTVLGGFRVDAPLGVGGMATVYRASQLSLQRPVALKVLPQGLARDPQFVARFDRESAILASLSHPNIITIYDRGVDKGHYFFAMELVDGATLRELINRKQVRTEDAFRVVSEVCDALGYAHQRGVIHRDMKPSNVLLDRDGRVKVADFGIAHLARGGEDVVSQLTMTNARMGTQHYMAPEQQFDARSVDARADIYAVGVMFYELLTGQLPLGSFDLPSQRLPGLDARVDEVIQRSLKTDPAQRFQSPSEIMTVLRAIRAGTSTGLPAAGATAVGRTDPPAGRGAGKSTSASGAAGLRPHHTAPTVLAPPEAAGPDFGPSARSERAGAGEGGVDRQTTHTAPSGTTSSPGERCPRCQYLNRVGGRVCLGCGASLVRACPRCKVESPLTAEVCVACGLAITQYLEETLTETRRSLDELEEWVQAGDYERAIVRLNDLLKTPGEEFASARERARRRLAEVKELAEGVVRAAASKARATAALRVAPATEGAAAAPRVGPTVESEATRAPPVPPALPAPPAPLPRPAALPALRAPAPPASPDGPGRRARRPVAARLALLLFLVATVFGAWSAKYLLPRRDDRAGERNGPAVPDAGKGAGPSQARGPGESQEPPPPAKLNLAAARIAVAAAEVVAKTQDHVAARAAWQEVRARYGQEPEFRRAAEEGLASLDRVEAAELRGQREAAGKEAEKRLAEAEAAYAEGRTTEAVALFEALARDFPTDEAAGKASARAQRIATELKGAAALEAEVKNALEGRRFRAARELVLRLRKEFPKGPHVGRAVLSEEAASTGISVAEGALAAAGELVKRGKFDEAAKAYDDLEKYPEWSDSVQAGRVALAGAREAASARAATEARAAALARAKANPLVLLGVALSGRPGLGAQVEPEAGASAGGLRVRRIVPGSAAEEAGLASSQVITRVDDQPVVRPQDLAAAVRKAGVGGRVHLVVRDAGGRELRKSVTLGPTWLCAVREDPQAGAEVGGGAPPEEFLLEPAELPVLPNDTPPVDILIRLRNRHFGLEDSVHDVEASLVGPFGESLPKALRPERVDCSAKREVVPFGCRLGVDGPDAFWKPGVWQLLIRVDGMVLRKLDCFRVEEAPWVACKACGGSGACARCRGTLRVSCPRCAGTRAVDVPSACPDCQGTGLRSCTRCNGKGVERCPKCNGSGRGPVTILGHNLPCNDCQGKGLLVCGACRGQRGPSCPTCKGAGRLAGGARDTCPQCKGLGSAPCSLCAGTGKCGECRGLGRVKPK